MTLRPGSHEQPGSAVIDGIDVDALAAAVRSCPGVDDLDQGPLGSVATYLPGSRQVAGLRVRADRVTVQVRGTWGVSVPELATQIRTVAAPFVGGHPVDVVVSDLADPTPPPMEPPIDPRPSSPHGASRQDTPDSPTAEGNRQSWTTAIDAPNGASSFVSTTPTEEERPPSS
jgi:hypothetical protein